MMINNIISLNISDVMNNGLSFGERISYGLRMFALGMGTVFAVLAIIWASLLIFKLVATVKDKKKAEVTSDTAADEANAESINQEEISEDNDCEIAAAITAAVAMIYADENKNRANKIGFRVVSFGRSEKIKPWNER